MIKKKEESEITPGFFKSLENGGPGRQELECLEEELFSREETQYSIKLSSKYISSYFRNVNQPILHQTRGLFAIIMAFFLAFALRFQWGHLPQKIVCGSWVFGKTPSEGSPDSNHKRHVSKQLNFLFVMWVTGVKGRLGFIFFLIKASWKWNS